jgi:hypothetical protein
LTEEVRKATELRIEEQALTISQLTNDVSVLQMKKEELKAELELANLKLGRNCTQSRKVFFHLVFQTAFLVFFK